LGRILEIKVVPNSRVEKVIEEEPIIVKVRDPPEKGKANRAVIKLLSKHFGSKVRLIAGKRCRKKLVEIVE